MCSCSLVARRMKSSSFFGDFVDDIKSTSVRGYIRIPAERQTKITQTVLLVLIFLSTMTLKSTDVA
jgi:hypothetical protein